MKLIGKNVDWEYRKRTSIDKGMTQGCENFAQTFSHSVGFPGASEGRASAYNVGDPGSIPGLGISSGEGEGYGSPLQYSCLENPMD